MGAGFAGEWEGIGMTRLSIGLALVLALAVPTAASATTVTFDGGGFVHGTVVDGSTDFSAFGISSIVITNPNRDFPAGPPSDPDIGVTFDSGFGGATSDTDLLGPPWSGGNISGTTLDNMLIIQENFTGCGDGTCDDPDDEGSRPLAGTIDISFITPISFFGLDLIDIDDTTDEPGFITFTDSLSASVTIFFADFEAGGSNAVPGLVFGDNTANNIPAITAASIGLSDFDQVVITMGGSGAIDNLVIPEPTTAVLLLLGGGALAWIRRGRL